jgi:hypothetical protein
MTVGDESRTPAAAEAARLVSDAVFSALASLVEALHDDRGDARGAEVQLPARLPPRAATDLLGALAAGLVPAVLRHIDPNALLDRVDVQRLIERVDVQALVRRIDVDELAAQVDPNRLLARVDVDELVRRIDLAAVAREAMDGIDVGEMIRESTATLGSDAVEDLRAQAMRADDLVARIVDRALRRTEPRDTALDRAGEAR